MYDIEIEGFINEKLSSICNFSGKTEDITRQIEKLTAYVKNRPLCRVMFKIHNLTTGNTIEIKNY